MLSLRLFVHLLTGGIAITTVLVKQYTYTHRMQLQKVNMQITDATNKNRLLFAEYIHLHNVQRIQKLASQLQYWNTPRSEQIM